MTQADIWLPYTHTHTHTIVLQKWKRNTISGKTGGISYHETSLQKMLKILQVEGPGYQAKNSDLHKVPMELEKK